MKLTGEVSTTLASPADGTDPKHGERRCHMQRTACCTANFLPPVIADCSQDALGRAPNAARLVTLTRQRLWQFMRNGGV